MKIIDEIEKLGKREDRIFMIGNLLVAGLILLWLLTQVWPQFRGH